MADFLWHKVSESEKEEIRKQAKKIMDNFSKKLDKVGTMEESFIERDEFERKEKINFSLGHKPPRHFVNKMSEEGKEKPLELDREIMFENAPCKNKDFIVAEKGGWKE